jgi:hypothetical protein
MFFPSLSMGIIEPSLTRNLHAMKLGGRYVASASFDQTPQEETRLEVSQGVLWKTITM